MIEERGNARRLCLGEEEEEEGRVWREEESRNSGAAVGLGC
jgi:hypothetical protein